MAASVERALAKAAAALLPGLLPTPPPLMTTPSPCITIIIPPAASNPKHPKPGRADAVERWDAHKNYKNRPRSPASSSSSCGRGSPTTSPAGRADSCERWDTNKKIKNPISISSSTCTSSSSSMSSRGSSVVYGEMRYKRPPSRASSATDRWDAHKKKPRDALSDAESHTGDLQSIGKEDKTTTMEETAAPRSTHLVFSGPTFVVASPEPSTLPMPAFFFPRRAGVIPVPAFVQAH